MAGAQLTYTATPVEPGDDPARIVNVSTNVSNLDTRLADLNQQTTRPIVQASQTGSFEGNVTPQLASVLEALPSQVVQYTIYNGSYYQWNTTVNDDGTSARIRMDPINATSVLDAVAKPYDTAPTDVQTAIETGSVESGSINAGVYQRGSSYYTVAAEDESALTARVLGAGVGYVLTPVGRGFIAVAVGILYYRYQSPSDNRVLTVPRAVAVAALSIPITVVLTALEQSPSLTRFITDPASAFVVSASVIAGVLIHQRRWAALIGTTVGVAVLVLGANVLANGLAGIIFGLGFLVLGFIAGGISLVYGVVFGQEDSDPELTNTSGAQITE